MLERVAGNNCADCESNFRLALEELMAASTFWEINLSYITSIPCTKDAKDTKDIVGRTTARVYTGRHSHHTSTWVCIQAERDVG